MSLVHMQTDLATLTRFWHAGKVSARCKMPLHVVDTTGLRRGFLLGIAFEYAHECGTAAWRLSLHA